MREVSQTEKLQFVLAVLFLLLLTLAIAVVWYGAQEKPFGDQKTTTYKDTDLRISVTFPETWKQSERAPGYFRGPSTFLRVNPQPTDLTNLEGVCEEEATTKPRKYGTNPTLQFAHIGGQRGCYIHGASTGQQSAIIVKTKRTVYSYDEAYRFVIIETSKADLLAIGETVRVLA